MKSTKSYKTNYKELAELFDVLSNPIRLQILDLLSKKEHSLSQLTEAVGIRKPNVSQHLLQLRLLRIVKVEKRAQVAIYSLANQEIKKYLK